MASSPTDLDFTANIAIENSAIGTLVGTVLVTDPDVGDTYTFALTDDGGGLFVIDAATGELTVAGDLDYETATSHEVTVLVTDSDGLTFEKTVTIEVADLNDFEVIGIDKPDSSGVTIRSAGDINGDGFDDLIIGAPLAEADASSNNAGQSYVVFGKSGGFGANIDVSTLDGTNGFVISGLDRGDLSGYAVSSAGDVNGDGYDDLIIGAPGAEDGTADRGAGQSYVVFGRAGAWDANFDLSTLDGTNGFVITGVDRFDASSSAVSSAGDVNGDGFDDIIVGAPGAEDGVADMSSGESYVVFGRADGWGAGFDLSTLNGTNGFVIRGGDRFDLTGYSVSSAGDVNGDGFDDIIVGAPGAEDGVADMASGQSYVVFGQADGWPAVFDLSTLDGTNGFAISGIDKFDQSGFLVTSAGDVDRDGFDDFIILADSGSGTSAGEGYLVFGSDEGWDATFSLSELDGENGIVLEGISDYSMITVSDVDNDGFSDVIIGGTTGGDGFVIWGQDYRDVNQIPVSLDLDNDSVDENSALGTVVGQVSVFDPDPDDTHSFSLLDDAGGRSPLTPARANCRWPGIWTTRPKPVTT